MVRRARFADGTPKPLPKPERNFSDKLKTLKEVSKGISPESRLRLLDYFIQEALTKGQLTEEQASGIYNQLREDKDKIRKQIDDFETGNFKDPFRTTREDFSEGSKEIPIEQLTKMTEESKELSPKMKELLDNYKAEYNNAYKQILLFPERPITEEFVEKLLDARKKLMEYGYLSEEERRYHQDILDATQKTIDRFQKDPNFKIERKDVAEGGRANFARGTPITNDIIELVKKYRIEDKMGSGMIADAIQKNDKLNVGRSTVTKILKRLKDQGVKGIDIPMSELASSVAQRLDPDIPPVRGGQRKIYKLIRPVRELDFKQNSKIPKWAKFKVQLPTGIPTGQGPTTEIKYFKTKEAAEAGIKKAEANVLKAKQLKAKPFDDAVKAIHNIALESADGNSEKISSN